MGAGIAQLGALAGIETLVYDPIEGAVERGMRQIKVNLMKGAERGRWEHDRADAAMRCLRPAASLHDLEPAVLVIEAAPERLELKRELFERLSKACGPDTILATNTSSILVSSIESAAPWPENVVALHFSDPAALMK